MAAAGVVGAAIPLAFGVAGQVAPAPALLAAALAAAASGLAIRLTRAGRPPSVPASAGSVVDEAPEPPFAMMIEHLVDPILLVAGGERHEVADLRFLFANAAARDLLRLQRREGLMTTAIRAPEVLAAVEEALFGGIVAHALYESRGVQERFWRVRVMPLDVESGPAGGRLALLSLRDETEVRRSERTRADFLANASHELRTPLASLAGFIETLRGHARDDVEAREKFLAIMHVQADRMRRLIDDLMSLSRIELAEHIAPSGAVDVPMAVIDVLDALGPLAAERGVTFEERLPARGEAIAIGDRDQIVQVIQNLAENALKYTPPGEVVRVEVASGLDAVAAAVPRSATSAHLSLLTPDPEAGRRYVALRVGDVGAGIARQNLPRLTERFFRVEGQKGGERAGTGLGLAIVKHIVNRHRGGLTVESAEGVGSTFTAYVPMAETQEAPPTGR